MEIADFTIEELSKLEKLLQVSTNVSNILDTLCTLEINGQKDSKEYYKNLLELTRTINIENEEYQNINLTYQQCYKFAKLLSTQINTTIFDIKPTSSVKNYNTRVIKRVINILINIMQNDINFQKSIISEIQIIKLNNSFTKDDFLKGLNHNFKIQNALNTDINSMFLSILENYISKKEYQKYHKELIKIKYSISTTNKELEAFLLTNKLSIPSIVHISSKIIAELLQEELSYDTIRFTELKTKAQLEINKLLNIKDSEYNNPTTYVNSIISSCYIRALFSLMTGKEINDFNEEFHEQIDKAEYLKEHRNDRISENMIITCFKYFNQDKEKTRVISTKSRN